MLGRQAAGTGMERWASGGDRCDWTVRLMGAFLGRGEVKDWNS